MPSLVSRTTRGEDHELRSWTVAIIHPSNNLPSALRGRTPLHSGEAEEDIEVEVGAAHPPLTHLLREALAVTTRNKHFLNLLQTNFTRS